MATLKEVARLAGVSASTVSRIINGKGEKCAGAAVQKRVWDAVRATGYVPNQEAKRLKEGGGTPKETITVSCLFARRRIIKRTVFSIRWRPAWRKKCCGRGAGWGPGTAIRTRRA